MNIHPRFGMGYSSNELKEFQSLYELMIKKYRDFLYGLEV